MGGLQDKELLKFLITIPKGLLIFIVVFTAFYVSALTYTSITTERNVTFWPPSIGDGPKARMIEEITKTKESLKSLKSEHYAQIKFLREQLALSREKKASTWTSSGITSNEYSENARKYAEEISSLEKSFHKSFNEITNELKSLETKLKENSVICE